ncbi:MAG: hypothetical protein COU08_04025 [Candidatus Harrisonbacteria bacterium CG10_big_fil_rev_8_21_14_0_10_42_17]|uniref:DUF2914 domain-containing protein n=1 Tax=Candidatus Harrisonbacteria bacterium CG10_big_fil_rev_8_21_14_0_10_42_17 TaxID=1974584 RepID=A0A2M6WH71_9BACT|nr:MAG: hypothetical protein COU08_04025 [Candidatus Harrisonbacteria bacterium CG10_big_fil_rev_8_21_14_0_10_42_17]
MIQKIKSAYKKHPSFFYWLFFGTGFIIDNLTFRRVDLLFENIVIFSYLGIAGLSIILMNAYHKGELKSHPMKKLRNFLPLPMQYAFGGLFSGFVIFYARSSSIVASWPFLLILILLFIGNDLLKNRYARLTFQISIYYIAIFSFAIFYVPVVTKTIGAGTFIASGFVSLVVIRILIWIIRKINKSHIEKSRRMITLSIGSIYILFNVFYFTNIIPPIPLALKETGIFHKIERSAGNSYIANGEKPPFYQPFELTSRTFAQSGHETAYFWSAVFAPTDLKTNIFHKWMMFNEEDGVWTTIDKIGYEIIGGRNNGYRGWTLKRNIEPGKWRVDVVTERDQLLGRTTFKVIETEIKQELQQVTL